MIKALGLLSISGAMLLAGVTGASAVTVEYSVPKSSTQDDNNTAGLDFAVGYGAYVPTGATWVAVGNPMVTPPPANANSIYQSPFHNNSLGNDAADSTPDSSYFSVGATNTDNAQGAADGAYLKYTAPQTVFNLLWGSIDTYNSLSFLAADLTEVLYTLTGTDILNYLHLPVVTNSEHVALVDIKFTEGAFYGVRFNSSSAAFEHAFAPVPLPAAGALLLMGLGGLFAVSRVRRRATTVARPAIV